MATQRETLEALQRERRAPRCKCQRAKKAGDLFCRQCLLSLADPSTRADRYKLSGLLSIEMAKSWQRCLVFLQEQGWIREGVSLG